MKDDGSVLKWCRDGLHAKNRTKIQSELVEPSEFRGWIPWDVDGPLADIGPNGVRMIGLDSSRVRIELN